MFGRLLIIATKNLFSKFPVQEIKQNSAYPYDWKIIFYCNLYCSYLCHLLSLDELSGPNRNGSKGSETAVYFTLSMYLFSLVVPLVVVWTVNICTISAYRKKHKVRKLIDVGVKMCACFF